MTNILKCALLAGVAAFALSTAPAFAVLPEGGGDDAPGIPEFPALPEIGGGELPVSIIVTPPQPGGDLDFSGGDFSLTGGELIVVVTPPSGGAPEFPPSGLPGLPDLPAPPEGGGLPDLAGLPELPAPPGDGGGLPGLPALPIPPDGGGLPGLPELPAPPGGGGAPGLPTVTGSLTGELSVTM